MKLEFQTRQTDGSYKKRKDIANLYFQEDGEFCYLIIEMLDGTKKRYLLHEHSFLPNDKN